MAWPSSGPATGSVPVPDDLGAEGAKRVMSTIHPRVAGGPGVLPPGVPAGRADPGRRPGEGGAATSRAGGRPSTPTATASVALKDGAVSMKIPGVSHDFASDIRLQNSPRVLSKVRGDFIVEVKVSGGFRPGATEHHPGPAPLPRGRAAPDQGPGELHQPASRLRLHRRQASSLRELRAPQGRGPGHLAIRDRDPGPGHLPPPGASGRSGLQRHQPRRGPLDLLRADHPGAARVVQLGVVGISSSDVPLAVKFRDFASSARPRPSDAPRGPARVTSERSEGVRPIEDDRSRNPVPGRRPIGRADRSRGNPCIGSRWPAVDRPEIAHPGTILDEFEQNSEISSTSHPKHD